MDLPEIRQNDFQRQWDAVRAGVIRAIERVGASGCYILGDEVQAFEAAFAEFCGAPHSIGVANGMDAIEIGLRGLGLRKGTKVLTTPFSAFASTLAIIRAGGVPVFVDVDEFGALDLRQCRAVFEQDRSIRFFLPVHLFGFPMSLPVLARLRDEFSLSIVEDSAQAIGAADHGIAVGSIGHVAAMSFYPTKNLGAFGDAGALWTNDAEIARRARALRNYGQSSRYAHEELGLNSRLDELHAAILRDALLPHLETWLQARATNAQKYLAEIANPSIRLIRPRLGATAVWHLFPVLVAPQHRDAFRKHLAQSQIETAVHYPRLIPEQKALSGVAGVQMLTELVHARRFADGEVSLPIHPFLTEDELNKVVDVCNAWRP